MAPTGRDIVCIGASAGGLQPLRELIHELPSDLPAAVFAVVHTGRDNPGALPGLLRKVASVPVDEAREGQAVERGRIYVPPPDHHVILERERLRVVRGPRENGFRPAIDPLFRTAAIACGPRVVGVVLSGGLSDGTAGLIAIKQAGGIAMVQEPEGALVPTMPLSAMARVEVDHVLDPKALAAMIVRLACEPLNGRRRPHEPAHRPVIA
jgi:two-component system chemotaxis response regulator CheB